MLKKLIAEHDRLRAIGRELAALVSTDSPSNFVELANKRSEMARLVHRHLAYESRVLFPLLARSPDPVARQKGASFNAAIEKLHVRYTQHVAMWRADDVTARWPEFQVAIKAMVQGMTAQLDLEERELFPLAIGSSDVMPPWQHGMRNWAGEGIVLQSAIQSVVSDPSAPAPQRFRSGRVAAECELVYVSRSVLPEPNHATELHDIVATARRRNAMVGITGALIATRSHFAQLIEGPGGAVTELMNQIRRDPRHKAVTVLRSAKIVRRSRPDWSMAYCGPSSAAASRIASLLGGTVATDPSASSQLMSELRGA